MKRITSIILVTLLMFCFFDPVFAQDSKKATDIYCSGEEGALGCIYPGNESQYSFGTPSVYFEPIEGSLQNQTVSLVNGTLTKGYTAADKNNHLVYAACYKIDTRNNPEKVIYNPPGSTELKNKYTQGVYYVFQVYVSDETGVCKYNKPDIIVYHATSNSKSTTYAIKGINNDTGIAKVDSWNNNTMDGGCPKYFGSAQKGKYYIFTDIASNLKSNDYDDYGFDASCTVTDPETEKTATACFNNKYKDFKKELDKYSCPSNISSLSDIDKIADKYTDVKECLSGGDADTYSYSIIKRLSDNYKKDIVNAIKTKYFTCSLDICGLTEAEKSRVKDRVGSIYEDSEIGNLYSSGLSTDKINCLTNNVKKADKIVADIEQDIDEGAKEKADENNEERSKASFTPIELDFNDDPMTCEEILGPLLTKIVRSTIKIVQIVAAIAAIVKGMLLIVPAVVAKDEEELKRVSKKLINLAIILALILILGPIVRILGTLLGYDVTCIM